MPIYSIKAPNGKIYDVNAPEGASQEDLFGFVQQQLDEENLRRLQKETTGVFETGKRAVARGFGQLGSTFTDVIPAAVGSALGFEDYARGQLEEAEQKRIAREAKYPTLFRSYKEIEGFGDFTKYATEAVGEQLANIATSLIPGIGAGKLAGSLAGAAAKRQIGEEIVKKGLVGEAADQFALQRLKELGETQIAPRMALGQTAGIYLGSYAQNAPEVFQNIYENNNGQLAPGAAALFSLVGAALDAALPSTIAKQLTGPVKIGIVEKVLEKSGMDKGLLRSITAGALSGVGKEGATEAAQEAISIAAERFVAENPKVFGSKEWDRIIESAIKGAVAGGAFGGVGGGVGGLRTKEEVAEEKTAFEDAQKKLKGTLEKEGVVPKEVGAVTGAAAETEAAPTAPTAPTEAPTFLGSGESPEAVQARIDAQTQQARAEVEATKRRFAEAQAAPEAFSRPETPAPAPKPSAPSAQPVTEAGVKVPGVDSAVSQLDRTLSRYQSEIQGLKGIRDDVKAAAIRQLTGSFINAKGQVQSAFGSDRADALKTGLEELKTIYDTARGKKFAAPAKITAPTVEKPQVPAKPEAPAPVTLESISKIDDPVAFGKLLGIGRTARVLRADGPLAGADLSNPDDVKRVKAALEGYASGKPAPGAAEKIEKLFQRPEFQEVSTDVTRLDEQPSGAGTEVLGGRDTGAPAGTAGEAKPSGMDTTGSYADESVGREGEKPSALITPAETPNYAAMSLDELRQVRESADEINDALDLAAIRKHMGEEVAAAYEKMNRRQRMKWWEKNDLVAMEQDSSAFKGVDEELIDEYINAYNNFDTESPRDLGRSIALAAREADKPNFASSPEYVRLRNAFNYAKEQGWSSDEVLEGMRGKAKEWAGRDAGELFGRLFKAVTEAPGIKEVTTEQRQAKLPAPEPTAPREKGKKLSLPKYEGPKFDDTQRKLAESGDVNGLLRNLLDSIKDPEIKQVLRRIRSLNLKTKIKIAPIGQSGIYNNALTDTDPDTIFLDPEQGMNAHTFIHEAVHAAISNVLSNPNHSLTKQFQKFFISVQDRLGAAYGATDLQEFAAELTSNPSFQAVLKTIKAPKSENMFVRILQSIAEFFGFPPKTTAFEKGIKFLNDAIDITNDVPATAAERLFLGDATNQSQAVNEVQEAQPSLVGKKIEETRNFLSNLSGSEVQRLALGLLRLDNIYDLYKKELPSIKMLMDAVERRAGQEERDIAHASENFKKFLKVQKKFPAPMRALNDLAIRASDAQVNLLSDKFEYRLVDIADWEKMTQKQRDNYQMVEAQRKRDYNALKPKFDALPDQVKEVYRAIRDDFDKAFQRYRSILEDAAKGSPALLAKLREEFILKQPLIGYIPFRRYGDFWLEFVDPNTDAPVAMSFESIRERQKFIDEQLKDIPEDPRRPRYVAYNKFNDIKFDASNIPPTHFLNDVVKKLRDEGASDTQIDSVYQAYLAAFPAESIAKQFMKRTGKRGMEADIVRGYNDLMVRWARKLANSEYLPKIDQALEQIKQEGQAHQRATGGDPAVGAAVQNILDQRAFLHNPTYNSLVSGTAQLSFFEFMAGNISSAVINLTSLPLMVYPLLTGKFGWGDVVPAMTSAMREATNNWGDMAKYKNLYKTLDDHGQLKHTMAREVLEGRRQKSEDYTGVKARIMDGLAYPFSVSERWNRATTAIAAFNLAIKKGMNEQQAIDYALETVKTAHTSGMAVTGPRWMQTPLGRMFFTFKSIVWQQAYVLGRAFYQAFKGETKKIRNAAQRQLLATYGMATVFVGVKGMPFYGAVSVLAEMLASMFGDDDEPFDFNEFMRSVFGEFLYKGAFNYFTNLEVANRAGLATDLVFRDDPRGVAEHGYVFSALQQMFGPVGSIAVNSERAVKMFKDGHYERSLETVAPSFFRNVMKGVRYMNEGAVTLKGDPIDEDIGAYNSVMQVVGFAPADLSNKYEMLQMAKGFERAVELRRRDALRMYDIAYRSGDTELMDEARERIQSFNQKHPKYRITQDSLTRSRKAREAAEREMIYGVRFNKNLRGEIKERFFEEE